MTPQGSFYALQNLIGTILCESSIIQPNQVTSSLSTVFVLSYAPSTKISTGFPAITRGVSMRITNQMRISWNRGTWKARFSSKFVDFLLLSVCTLYVDFSQVYKSIFTSPSSAKNILDEENDTENMVPTKSQKISSNNSVRRNVASKLHLNKVTPRSVAYAAVQACVCHCFLHRRKLICDCQLHFNLQTAGSWTSVYGGFDYHGLYNYIVDFFEDTPGPAAKKRAQELLNWWSM